MWWVCGHSLSPWAVSHKHPPSVGLASQVRQRAKEFSVTASEASCQTADPMIPPGGHSLCTREKTVVVHGSNQASQRQATKSSSADDGKPYASFTRAKSRAHLQTSLQASSGGDHWLARLWGVWSIGPPHRVWKLLPWRSLSLSANHSVMLPLCEGLDGYPLVVIACVPGRRQ